MARDWKSKGGPEHLHDVARDLGLTPDDTGSPSQGLRGPGAPKGAWHLQGSRIMQHTTSPPTRAVPPLCFPVKLKDFEAAVNNFEKALERAKLLHNNEAQQAIISVSLSPSWASLGFGVGGPSAPQPSQGAYPQRLITHHPRAHGR